ncbi:MAG: M48 family metalloprotease [Aestuariivirga sp.]
MMRNRDPQIIRKFIASLLAMMMAFAGALPAQAQSGRLPLIRDAEIEGLMRIYTRPILKAAGLNPKAVRVYLISDPRINAFVAGGQRIFINTGLLTESPTPNEVIGVLAHETGHIAGGHLARIGSELDRASVTAIVGMLVGLAAMVGGAAAGQTEAAQAGQGVMMGSQGLAQRNVLTYQRSMESAADQAALKYLKATGQSPKGMLTLFEKLASQSIATLQNVSPYVMSHPMPFERIRNLETAAKASPYFDKKDPPELMLRHQLMQAKLAGYQNSAKAVFRDYPTSDQSMPARYARAIAMYRQGDIKNALPVLDSLIKDLPENPYFWELKGQALMESGRPSEALEPIRKAMKLLPNSGLIQILMAQALIGTNNKNNAKEAVSLLKKAQRTENDMPVLYQYLGMAYGKMGDIPRAELATAEFAMLRGDRKLALDKANAAQKLFKTGTPEWTRANDILTFASRK